MYYLCNKKRTTNKNFRDMRTKLNDLRTEVTTNIINTIVDLYKKENGVDAIDWNEDDVCVKNHSTRELLVEVDAYDSYCETEYAEGRVVEMFCVFESKGKLFLNLLDEDGEEVNPNDLDTDTLVEVYNFVKRL